MVEFKYEIVEKVGVLSEKARGWSRCVNYISWDGREPKLDIRDWSPNMEKMGKGISLTREEAAALKDILNAMEF